MKTSFHEHGSLKYVYF